MVINSFKGEYSWLSNMYPSPVKYQGVAYTCAESAYQSAKTLVPEEKALFLSVNGYQAKKLGRQITLRADWNEVRIEVMCAVVLSKFLSSPELYARLLATEDAHILEGNYWHDNFWGSCTCTKCSSIVGQNYLGRILMTIRDTPELMEVK